MPDWAEGFLLLPYPQKCRDRACLSVQGVFRIFTCLHHRAFTSLQLVSTVVRSLYGVLRTKVCTGNPYPCKYSNLKQKLGEN